MRRRSAPLRSVPLLSSPLLARTPLRALLLAAPLLGACASAGAQAPGPGAPYDLVVRNARVLDGTGNPWFAADVAVRDGRIAAVGRLGDVVSRRTVDATGLYLAPGFIDTHSHAGPGLEDATLSAAEPLLAQGVTTVVVNPDGGGPTDLVEQRRRLEAHGLGVNVALLIGHGAVRQAVLGDADREATAAELDRMRRIVGDAMTAGAFGLSSGLFYTPAAYAPLAEVIELARVAAAGGGVYTSHIRDEADYSIGVIAAVEEVIEVARQAGLPGVVTHIKVLGPRVWGFSAAVVHRIEEARAAGVEVYADQYPYLASSTSLAAALLPAWSREGGRDALLARLADPAARARIRTEMADNLARRGGADRIQFRRHREDPSIEGRTLAALAADRGAHPLDVALALLEDGSPGIVSFNMLADDVERFMTRPWTMTASDGGLVPRGEGVPHPRSYGAFPRRIREYVVERGVTDLPHAVRSMTSLPARVFGLEGRGRIEPGAIADLVVFDLAALDDPATFQAPHQLARGMRWVLVGGEVAVADGAFTGVRAGTVLRR